MDFLQNQFEQENLTKNIFNIMQNKINYAGPSITIEDADAVRDAALNGFYENYRVHAMALESDLAKLLDVKYVIATNSCTAALHLAVASLGLGEGDEVITTDSSCVASAMPIAYENATPVFVDVDPNTWCLSPQAIRNAITPRTKAILAVHWNGHPADMNEIMKIADEHNLLVIEDAAAALGAKIGNRRVGSIGNVGCYSFQGAKVAIGGQGGAYVTNDAKAYERAKQLASYGRTDSKMAYWSDYIGWNYSMPNLPAALAASQLKRLDQLIEFKRALFSQYKKRLNGVKNLRLIEELSGTWSTCCYPPLLLDDGYQVSRAELLARLKEKNIDARNAQPRMSQMPMFESRFVNTMAEKIETNGVILPSAFNLSSDDINRVCDEIIRFA